MNNIMTKKNYSFLIKQGTVLDASQVRFNMVSVLQKSSASRAVMPPLCPKPTTANITSPTVHSKLGGRLFSINLYLKLCF